MKLRGFVLCLGLLVLFWDVPGADAGERYSPWVVGARGGPSILTQDAVDNTNIEGEVGPIFNGLVVYNLSKYVSFGFEAEWEQHKIDQATVTLGDASTASLLVRFEGSLDRSRPVSPYFLFAAGYNFNSFSEEDAYVDACGGDCRIEIDNSFTIKAGFGVDLFLLFENAALNIEFAWKYNKADMDFISDGTVVASDDYNGSALSLLLGFRYHFPVDDF